MTSSQMAQQSGEQAVPTLFGIPGRIIPPYDSRNAVNEEADKPSQTQATGRPRVIVNSPPKLPSGTQKAIENIVQAHMERLGINARSQQERVKVKEKVWLGMYQSRARNLSILLSEDARQCCTYIRATSLCNSSMEAKGAPNVHRCCH